jgi:adenine phosphoribosyltransferase
MVSRSREAGGLSTPLSDVPLRISAPIPHVRWRNHPRIGVDYPCLFAHEVSAEVFRLIVDAIAGSLAEDVDAVAGVDSGLGLAGPVAYARGVGVVDIRKSDTIRPSIVRSLMKNHALGDGVVTPVGSVTSGRRIALIDDCLMSGGTAIASIQLIRRLGGICCQTLFVFELEGMDGRKRLEDIGVSVTSLELVPKQAQPT